MPLLSPADRQIADALAKVGYLNPFLPARVELERQIVGPKYVDFGHVINKPLEANVAQGFPNIREMQIQGERLATAMRDRLLAGESIDESEARLYEDVALYALYCRYDANQSDELLQSLSPELLKHQTLFWKEFATAHAFFFQLPGRSFPLQYEPSHIFATFFQIQRAFHNIFTYILGRSLSIAKLRGTVWNSIFTHDMQRYARVLYASMDDVPTLIQGPSGTGKELVAQAIGRSRYIPFDAKRQEFDANQTDEFVAINLSALAPGLIESELFGHGKGAFTNATTKREGYFGVSKPNTCVFLDEIGELDLSIQVKLLRVLQSREFHRVGETRPRTFHGKIITATNRQLLDEIAAGRFREDFYYRLCADLIHTPSLHQQLTESPDDLEMLVGLQTQEMIPNCPEEADRLTREVVDWIRTHLGEDYAWPGNFRELRQCIRNIMIRGSYTPAPNRSSKGDGNPVRTLADRFANGEMKLSEVVRHYIALVYAKEHTYEAAAQRLDINWRTVKNKMSPELVGRYRNSTANE